MRLVVIFLGLAILFAIPFLLWGEVVREKSTVEWLREYGDWAWAAALVLLVGDLVLPVPATAVMSALGLVYGTFLGALVGACGSILSGCVAYGLCRCLGRGAVVRLAGETDLERGERLFATSGGWLVVFSRWLPLFPEVVACMAGLTRMPLPLFLAALACGTLPVAFTLAAVGSAGVERPVLAIVLSAVLPLVLWAVARSLLRRRA